MVMRGVVATGEAIGSKFNSEICRVRSLASMKSNSAPITVTSSWYVGTCEGHDSEVHWRLFLENSEPTKENINKSKEIYSRSVIYKNSLVHSQEHSM